MSDTSLRAQDSWDPQRVPLEQGRPQQAVTQVPLLLALPACEPDLWGHFQVVQDLPVVTAERSPQQVILARWPVARVPAAQSSDISCISCLLAAAWGYILFQSCTPKRVCTWYKACGIRHLSYGKTSESLGVRWLTGEQTPNHTVLVTRGF